MTRATNNHPENVLTNIMIRVHYALKVQSNSASEAYLKSQSRLDKSAISLSSRDLEDGRGTLLTKSFMRQNKVCILSEVLFFSDINKLLHSCPCSNICGHLFALIKTTTDFM